ncbi:MAG TPA: metallophosphoesterase [Syntrophothermus lipocalidus]|uniref:Phosphoesterase n=1 Tax=Syntrophothermus lipocalidus (strain DSM 12680 / TGB-C1) TaxID=643648 RepID=D7CIR7_SYNLT|nr:metallophosphoesterase [Syntrophothermus lipocalidus]ADI02795.1 phosphodiesterase, MJ0936 family [Syntrophothermus lipocalidus DSM 12680]HHV77521.1 metallophosphoesterase [Syntrophothermus lipocalidus]
MRIVVCGDTHGRINMMKAELGKMEGVDLLLHTGDFYKDGLELARFSGVQARVVVGNCDIGMSEPAEDLFEIEGYRFLLTHGHLYRVKNHLISLKLRAKETGADVVVFGHTHEPGWEKIEGIWFLNPGSASLPRLHQYGTYALVEIDQDRITTRLVKIR